MAEPTQDRVAFKCSFCTLFKEHVVAGGTQDLFICGQCARLALEILDDQESGGSPIAPAT
jgi:hypothetical protein